MLDLTLEIIHSVFLSHYVQLHHFAGEHLFRNRVYGSIYSAELPFPDFLEKFEVIVCRLIWYVTRSKNIQWLKMV